MLTYYETPEGSYSPNIQQACDRLVRELHAIGLSGARLKRRLGLMPRSPCMRFYHADGDLPMSPSERTFVEEMRAFGIEERQQIDLGTGAGRSWSDFPEIHDYLQRSVARLERSLHETRLEEAQRKEAEYKKHLRPVQHAAATLADILGQRAKSAVALNEPHKTPEAGPKGSQL